MKAWSRVVSPLPSVLEEETFSLFLLFRFLLTAHCSCFSRPAQRRQRQRRLAQNVNDVIRGLNWMAGYATYGDGPDSAMQHMVVRRLEGLVFDQKPILRPPTPEAALLAMLSSRSLHDVTGSHENLVSYTPELVSILDDLRGIISLER
jgi:hypothetical protein